MTVLVSDIIVSVSVKKNIKILHLLAVIVEYLIATNFSDFFFYSPDPLTKVIQQLFLCVPETKRE